MELRNYVAILRKYWISIVACTLAGISIASVVSLLTPPTYTSSASLFFTVRGTNPAELLQGSSYAESQVASYSQILTTPVVLQPVIDRLHLEMTPAELASSVSASTPPGTAILQITVEDRDPQRSAKLAQEIGAQVVTTVANLSPTDSTGTSSVAAMIVTPASVPTTWTSPRVPLNLAIGLLVGLALGIGQAVLRSTLDLKVRTEEDVARATQHTVIGNIPLADTGGRGPIVLSDLRSVLSESYRRLRTNLQFLDIAGRTNSFVVTSSIPGEGKTTTALNIASTVAEAGLSVLLIDADLRRPRVAATLGLENAVGLTTILIGRAKLQDVVQPIGAARLHVLASGEIPPNPTELLGSAPMSRLLKDAVAAYDTVVLDAPPLLPVTDAAILSTLTGGALVVAASGRVTIPQLRDAVTAIDRVDGFVLGIVLNKVQRQGRDNQYVYRPSLADDATVPESAPAPVVPARAPTPTRAITGG